MTGSDADWEEMTNKELHDKFATLVMANTEDVDKRLGEAPHKLADFEKSFDAKLDTKFNELLARLPPPPPVPPLRPGYVGRAQRVPLDPGQNSGVAADAADDYYEGEDENEGPGGRHQAAGRPRPHIRNAHAAPRPQVWHDDDHVAKLKLHVSPFEGRYDPDAYLTWELETEQPFNRLHYPDDRRVTAAVCAFAGFASIWWSEHCRVNPNDIPTTWPVLKDAMRKRWVPPYYQRDLLQKLQNLKQGKNSVEEYCQELQTGLIRCGVIEDTEPMLARFRGGLNKEI